MIPKRRWRGLFLPLGARLVGLFLVLAFSVSLTLFLGHNDLLHGGWREYVRPLVSNYIDLLVSEIGSPPDVERARALAQHLPLRIRIEGPTVNWDSADEPRPAPPPPPGPPPSGGHWHLPHHEVATLPGGDPTPLILPPPHHPPPEAAAGGSAPPRPPPRGAPHHLSLRSDIDPSGLRGVRHLADGSRIVIGLADMSHAERAEQVFWATLAGLLLLTAIAYAGVRWLLHPLAALRAGAIRYGQGDFSQPIATRRRDELGDLAEQINGMAARLHHMLDAKRQLLLAISHELRSPLARARLNAELVDDSTERTALLRDLGEMRDLITDLLESERLAGGHAALQTEAATLAEIAHAQCDAQAAAGVLALQLDESLPALPLDRMRMRLLLRNLVDNALRHGADAAQPPLVSTRADGQGAQARQHLVVRDHGPGMDEARLAHASEAFYRADAARQRSTGGVGLGLYLCKLVAEAHGGTLTVRNARPGLEIDVALPPAP